LSSPPDYFYNQSAVIPYRIKDEKFEVLLITSSSQKRWVIPKGLVELYLSPQSTAVQEAWEEAGITGQIGTTVVGRYEYEKWGGMCLVEVFLMRVDMIFDEWPESFRHREWVTIDEAAYRVDEAELRTMILELPKLAILVN